MAMQIRKTMMVQEPTTALMILISFSRICRMAR
jgi:hypothetical protein